MGLRVAFDRRLKLEFHGASVTSDAGLLAFRELDDALGLTAKAGEVLADPRTGRNGRHTLIAQLRLRALAGYEDVNDADRLGRVPRGQRAQRPRLARGARSGGGAVSWPGAPALAARRCGLRPPRRVRVPGGGGLPVRNPPACESGAPEPDRPPAHAPGGPPTA